MNIRHGFIILCSCAVLAFSPNALAGVGKVIIAKGEAFAVDASNASRPLKRRSDVLEGDTLVTGADSEIHIRFQDNAVLALRAQSQLKISEYHAASGSEQEKVLMELLSGGFRTITGAFGKTDKEAYQIRTPNASIGIRGTNYEALLSNSNLLVGVYQGGVSVTNASGSINLGLDSAFSFAQVGDQQSPIQGLMEAPAELSTPLAEPVAKSNAPSTTTEQEEPTAELNTNDETLITETLYQGEAQTLAAKIEPEVVVQPEALATVNLAPQTETTVNTLAANSDLSSLVDLRLTQQQIELLKTGAPVGFVVVNQDPSGYRLPVLQAPIPYNTAATGTLITQEVSFDIRLETSEQIFVYTITLAPSSSTNLLDEINNQLPNHVGNMNGTEVPARIALEEKAGNLVFTGLTDSNGAKISINNFQGPQATELAQALGLCDTTVNCTGTYVGAPSQNQYEHATHFGYVVERDGEPVFVNYENESITVLENGYQTPDNVFIGNEANIRYSFDVIDADGDGVADIDWGYWLASESAPSKLLKDPDNLANAEDISIAHYYAEVQPAPQAALIGTRSLTQTVAWYATSSTSTDLPNSAEMQNNATLSSSLSVDFSTGVAVGSLTFEANNNDWSWQLDHAGQVNGAQYQSDWGFGKFTSTGGSSDAVGHVDGLFTTTNTAAEPSLGFVGGFGMQTTNDTHHAEGVFFIKE